MRLAVSIVVAATAATLHAQGTLLQIDDAGGAVASVGDVDGDGRADVLSARVSSLHPQGRVRLVSSATGVTLVALDGPSAGDGYGAALAAERDLDGDGKPDFVVGAPNAVGTPGILPAARAYSANGTLLWTATGLAATRFGAALAVGGDLDGDGVGEVLVGAPDDGANAAGAVHVLSGASGNRLYSHVSPGPSDGEFGFALAFLGDLDGDGVDDYAIGDPHTAGSSAGAVAVISGASAATMRTLTAPAGGQFGGALARAGDVDGDGVGELVVGAPAEFVGSFTSGVVRLYSGASGVLIFTTLAKQQGLTFGRSVAGLGDYDRDGLADYAAQLPAMYVGGVVKNFGAAQVISGANGLVIAELDFGSTGPLASVGDVNFDGVPDVAIGGHAATPPFTTLVLGRCDAPTAYCTGKPNSLGCLPATSYSGAPSASIGPDFVVAASNVRGAKPALLFWGLSPAATPFGGGILCVGGAPVRTAVVTTSGSSGACDGVAAYTFTKSYCAAQGLTPGTAVYTQFWIRDPNLALHPFSLSRGLAFTIWP
ncbi:MAG: VCBS repeat-containing protein [Planctomycetes bacterium]|nr:VCBS repeat-containing protein [Planctomycetota bacterium]